MNKLMNTYNAAEERGARIMERNAMEGEALAQGVLAEEGAPAGGRIHGVCATLRSTRGASMMLALMAMMIATVASAIVLASATAVTTSLSNTYATERAYLSVESAVRSIEDAITGDVFQKQWVEHGERQGGVFTGGNRGYVYEQIGEAGYVYIDNGTANPFRTEISDLVYQQMTKGGDRSLTKTVVVTTHVKGAGGDANEDDTSLIDPVLVTFSMTNSTGTAAYGYSIKAEFRSAEYVERDDGTWDVVESDGYSAVLLMKISTSTGQPEQTSSYVSQDTLEEWENSGFIGKIATVVVDVIDSIDTWLNGDSKHVYRMYTSEASWDSSEFVLQKTGK